MRWWLRAGLTRVLTHAASAALLALILFPPAEASAQLRKSGRKGVLKPPPRAGDAPKKRRKGAASLEVETALDRKAVARGRAADAKRNEAIEELQKLIPVASESRKPEMTFRLAELYWEKSKYEYTLEMEAFEAAHAEWRDAGSPGRPPKRRVFLRQSERIKTTALRLYERVLKTSPTYPRNDEVLFYLGYNEYEAGNARRAVAHYWRLIKQFPESKLKAQAYLQLGEHFFNSNDVRRAQSAYERALATGEAQIANYARYKLAWCDYNVEDYDAGISKLKKVIDVSDAAGDSRAIELKSEALRDLARFFSFEGEVETAFEYFQEKGGEAIAQRYSAELAALFHGQGEWDLEIDTYRLLLDTYPMDERAPYYQASIVEALGKKSARRAIRVEVERLIDFYRPGTPWYRAQTDRGEAGDAAVEYAYDLMETKLRDMVTEYHRDAQKRKDARTYRLARDIYAKYLEAFPETESAFRMRYYYAEVLWALDEWGEAAGAYKAVASASTRRRTDKALARQAAYNQVVAWEKVARTGKMSGASRRKRRVVEKKNKGSINTRSVTRVRLRSLDKAKRYEPEALPPLEQNLSDACDLYFRLAARNDKDLPAIKFKAAYLYYKHNQFVEASKRYFEIIEEWPRNKLSKRAANLILDSLNVQEQWEELARYAAAFRDNRKLAGRDKAFKTEVQELLEGATYLSIQQEEKRARKLADAVDKEEALGSVAVRFQGFQREFPRSRYADKALFSAVLIYDQADELDHALAAAERMERRYGEKASKVARKKKRRTKKARSRRSKLRRNLAQGSGRTERQELLRRNHLLRATFYERIADFRTAARLYESYYRKYPDHSKASTALFNAGVYYEGLGDIDRAVAKFEAYIELFSSKDEARVYWRVCELEASRDKWKAAAECFEAFRQRYRTAPQAEIFESRYRYALALEKLKRPADAKKEFEWLVRAYPKLKRRARDSDEARLAGAHAAFKLLDPDYRRYAALKVTLRKKSLLAKVKGAEDLACAGEACKRAGRFLRVLEYGNGRFGICALTRIGEVYRDLADAIRAAPIPRKLSFDQQEIYRAELDTVALGPEEKGIEAFENALRKAYELNVYNRCLLKAQESLAEINPDQFPTLQRRRLRTAEGVALVGVREEVRVGHPADEILSER